ncbi:nuclear transport factor 2 family protein [Rhodobacteraceae bacterium F11138]|nr:nuclear transport factor 2 family protein [Rhodobacteraceae bacterium F11138]
MDYAEGWYTGDAERMKRALHPDFIKRALTRDPTSGESTTRRATTFANMVAWTREGEGKAFAGETVYEVRVLVVFRDIAAVRCLSAEYVDHLHLTRFDDGWKIVNVLWQLREGEMPPN